MNPQSFPEDALPLLAPKPILSFNPPEYWTYINSLFEPRTAAGKVAIIRPKGKILKAPTKSSKRPLGIFEIRFITALGEKKTTFSFDRDKKLQCDYKELSKKIDCPHNLMEEFLKKKNFSFTTSVSETI